MSSTKRGTIRQVNDHYDTPAYTTQSLLLHHQIEYPVLEPCAGNLAIVDMLNTDMVYTNDINQIVRQKHALTICDLMKTGMIYIER